MEGQKQKENGYQLFLMRWIGFVVITIVFLAAAIKAIVTNQETDKVIALLFLIIIGFAWGANIWKYILNKFTP